MSSARSDSATHCNHCGRTASSVGKANLLRCSGCKSAWFCSTEHQRANWKVHRPICQEMQKAIGAKAKSEKKVPFGRPLLFARPDFLETSLSSTAVQCSASARNTGPLSPDILPSVILRQILLFCPTVNFGRLSICAKFLLATVDELALDIAYENNLAVEGRKGMTKDVMAKSLPFLGLKLDATWAERVHRLENFNFVDNSERMLFCNFEYVRTDEMSFFDDSLLSPATNVRYKDMEKVLSDRLANLDEKLGRSLLASHSIHSVVVPAPRPGKALVVANVSLGTAFSAVLRIGSSDESLGLPLAKLACNGFRKEWTCKFPLRDSLSSEHAMSVALPLTLDTWETYADSSGGVPSSPGFLRRDEDVFAFRTTLKRRCFRCLVEIKCNQTSCGECDAADFPNGVASDLAVPVTEFVLWQGRTDQGGAGNGDIVHATVRYQDPLGSTGITISSVDFVGVSAFNYKMMLREIIKWVVIFFGPSTQIKMLNPPSAKRRFLEQEGWAFATRFALFWADGIRNNEERESDSTVPDNDNDCCIS